MSIGKVLGSVSPLAGAITGQGAFGGVGDVVRRGLLGNQLTDAIWGKKKAAAAAAAGAPGATPTPADAAAAQQQASVAPGLRKGGKIKMKKYDGGGMTTADLNRAQLAKMNLSDAMQGKNLDGDISSMKQDVPDFSSDAPRPARKAAPAAKVATAATTAPAAKADTNTRRPDTPPTPAYGTAGNPSPYGPRKTTSAAPAPKATSKSDQSFFGPSSGSPPDALAMNPTPKPKARSNFVTQSGDDYSPPAKASAPASKPAPKPAPKASAPASKPASKSNQSFFGPGSTPPDLLSSTPKAKSRTDFVSKAKGGALGKGANPFAKKAAPFGSKKRSPLAPAKKNPFVKRSDNPLGGTPAPMAAPQDTPSPFKKGGASKKYAKGGGIDGVATKGHTKAKGFAKGGSIDGCATRGHTRAKRSS